MKGRTDEQVRVDERVLALLVKPLIKGDIVTRTGLSYPAVQAALNRLRQAGKIVSKGATASRRHMRLATALDQLLREVKTLRHEVNDLKLRVS